MRRRRDLDRDADMFFGELRRRATLDVSKMSTWMHALLRYYRLEAAVLAGRERRGHGDCAVVKRRRLKPNRTTSFFVLVFASQRNCIVCKNDGNSPKEQRPETEVVPF